jgi:hypothetical protein
VVGDRQGQRGVDGWIFIHEEVRGRGCDCKGVQDVVY